MLSSTRSSLFRRSSLPSRFPLPQSRVLPSFTPSPSHFPLSFSPSFPPIRSLLDNVTRTSSHGLDEFARVEQQYEKNYVNEHEKEVMKKLMTQMNEFVKVANEESIGDLAQILTRYKVQAPDELKQDLIEWKTTLQKKQW